MNIRFAGDDDAVNIASFVNEFYAFEQIDTTGVDVKSRGFRAPGPRVTAGIRTS